MQALDIITDTRGLNTGPARISISTVGHVPGILRLAEHPRRYHLAVSLHAATDEERSALLPVNRRWPLADLMAACREYSERKKMRAFIAWTLIAGRNDSPDHARQLADLLRGMNVQVNLIPLNITDGYDGAPPGEAVVDSFQHILQAAGLPVTIRQRRGLDVGAGCGQLRSARRNVRNEKRETADAV
jgi:23S rRNA (adenine2503-C2)-methyltransferase